MIQRSRIFEMPKPIIFGCMYENLHFRDMVMFFGRIFGKKRSLLDA